MARPNNPKYVFSIITKMEQERELERQGVGILFSPEYIFTPSGLLKVVETTINLLLFIIIMCSTESSLGRLSFVSLTGGVGFFLTGLLLGCHIFNAVGVYQMVPWMNIEIAHAALWAALYCIGSTVCLLYIGHGLVFGLVPFFGYINTVTYGFDSFSKYKCLKNNTEPLISSKA